ncbi:hypothetical protein [Rheinheimera faecalis]|uniref:hypothetical protein n=1 Tax=Rheinheimera faecalis TaxID=2901141 RepID=UPI001E5E3276|nr:hypothetical protein [Rheinheimera faecalis]
MADHKLPAGKQLIQGIAQLGSVLGYHVEKEFPVDEPTYGESPAVDVAWFAQKGNRFPLFIFEVESKATNGMTNNPLKVYAQENRAFEKPLFFFHVVAQGGGNSSRPRNLESQYGKNNYRIYLVGTDSANDLIKDVLSQHARVRNDIDYISLYQLLITDLWLHKVEHPKLLMHAASLELSKINVISSFVKISRNDITMFPQLVELISKDSEADFENTTFESYLGSQWAVPIITALLCGLSENINESRHWSSLDEDLCLEFINVLDETLDKVGVCWGGLNSAIYLLHLSAATNDTAYFEKAKRYLLEFKSLSEEDVLSPPSCVSVMDGEFEDYFKDGELVEIQDCSDFSKLCKERYFREDTCIKDMALRALDDDLYIFKWSSELLGALWSSVANKALQRTSR